MKQIIGRLKKFGLRRIVTVFLATVTFLLAPAFNLSASAETLNNPGEYNPVTPDTVKRIQEKAEDLGDAPGRRIGDTGLENIRQIPEKIPKVVDLNARQQGAKYNPQEPNKIDALERAQEKVEK